MMHLSRSLRKIVSTCSAGTRRFTVFQFHKCWQA
jgi:hypothetical protein